MLAYFSGADNSSQFIYCPNVSSLTIQQAKIANYVVTISAAACLAFMLVQLSLLLLYKAYKTALQRLFFHYAFSTSVYLMSTVLMIELQFNISKKICSWLAFIKEWWYLNANLLLLGLVVTLTVTTYSKMRSKHSHLCRSRKLSLIFELLFTVLAFLLPLSYLWKIMERHRFGLYGSMCWMEMYNETCDLVSEGELRFSTVIVILQLLVVIIYSVLLIVLHLVIVKKYKQDRKSRLKFLGRALFLLVICDISALYVIIHHSMSHPKAYSKLNHVVYDIVDGLLENILGVLLPVAFGLYIYSPKKLLWKELKKAFDEFPICSLSSSNCCKLKNESREFDKLNGHSETFEASSDRVVPSHTTYSSPYTNEFTDITEIISKEVFYGSTSVRVAMSPPNNTS